MTEILSIFPQPESNDSSTVEAALAAIRNADDEASANEAYDAFLWAVGNNHAGTYYPVVLGTLAQLEQILRSGKEWPQRAAMECLIDLAGTFIPEPGYELHLGASVKAALKTFICVMRPHIAALADGSSKRSKSAVDLLELIDDQSD